MHIGALMSLQAFLLPIAAVCIIKHGRKMARVIRTQRSGEHDVTIAQKVARS
jgi:hypothetical protein